MWFKSFFRLKPQLAIRAFISSPILPFKKLRSNPCSVLRCPITGSTALRLLSFCLKLTLTALVTPGMKIAAGISLCLACPLYPLSQKACSGYVPVISLTCVKALFNVVTSFGQPSYVCVPTIRFPLCVIAIEVLQPNSYFLSALPFAMQEVWGSK